MNSVKTLDDKKHIQEWWFKAVHYINKQSKNNIQASEDDVSVSLVKFIFIEWLKIADSTVFKRPCG